MLASRLIRGFNWGAMHALSPWNQTISPKVRARQAIIFRFGPVFWGADKDRKVAVETFKHIAPINLTSPCSRRYIGPPHALRRGLCLPGRIGDMAGRER